MKTLTVTKIQILMFLTTLVLSVEGVAAVPCPNELFKGDNVLNLQEFGRHLEENFDKLDDDKINAKFDMRRKVTRHTIESNNPMIGLHAIGKVTAAKVAEGNPGFENSTKEEENKAWGTGFMISPCHMITNNHVVCEKEVVNGKKVCKRNENLKGKAANFSFGENETGSDFEKRVTGNVVASDEGLDYAIVRIDSFRNNDEFIPYIPPNFNNISKINDLISLGAGYPAQSRNEDNHKLYAMKAKLTAGDTNINGKMTFTPGNSGSPTMYIDKGVLFASGLFNSSLNDSQGKPALNKSITIVGFPKIGNSLMKNNPKILNEITNSLKTGRCE
ncbi:MAG: serine protease [Bdellovibrionota bacterium]